MSEPGDSIGDDGSRAGHADADQSGPKAAPTTSHLGSVEPGRRVNWSEVLADHDISPDAVSADPVAQPDPWARTRPEHPDNDAVSTQEPPRARGLHIVGWLAALFSLAASAAVLWVLVRGRLNDNSVGEQPDYDSASALAFYRAQLPAYTGPILARDGVNAGSVPDKPTGARAAKPDKPPTPDKPSTEAPTDTPPAATDSPALTDRPTPTVDLLPSPSDGDVDKALLAVRSALIECGTQAEMSGQIALKIQITEKGTVAWAAAKPTSTPFHACTERVLRTIRLPATRDGGLVRHTLTVP